MKKVVVYGGTANIYHNMRVALNSLLANNKIDRVYLLIEDDSFPFPLPNNVKVINVSEQPYFPPTGANFHKRWTYMTLMRCALTKILPKENLVLWLDCDTIVDADISELFEINMDAYYYAGVLEPQKSHVNGYINTGVLLVNLDKLREDEFEDELIDYINTTNLSFPDQDAINRLSQFQIRYISGKYNVSPFTEQSDEKKIYHFAGNAIFETNKYYQKYKG